jgi:RNA polymerase sigma-70 factor, ECF subfamily
MWFLSLYISNNPEGISPEEFRKIFMEMYSVLCVYAAGIVNDEEAAKDVVQEVLMTFWSENDKLRNKNLVKPYLFKSVKHKALNYKKRENRNSPLDTFFEEYNQELASSEDESAERYLALSSLMEELETAIEELPDQRRKVFKMSRFGQMKHKEIADALEISPKTVETHIFRSLQFLRNRLKHYL